MRNTQEGLERIFTSSERTDLIYAGSKPFLVLAFFSIILMIPTAMGDNDEAILALAHRVPLYGWVAFGFASVSGILRAMYEMRLAERS